MDRILPVVKLFISSLDFSEISEGSRVNCFGKFPNGEGFNRLRKFTGQGTCSHIHSELFLGNLRCYWDSVYVPLVHPRQVGGVTFCIQSPEPVVIVAIWRINREVVQGQSAVSGEAGPMLHVFSSYRQRTC